jgi:hypothetical protein
VSRIEALHMSCDYYGFDITKRWKKGQNLTRQTSTLKFVECILLSLYNKKLCYGYLAKIRNQEEV